MYSHHSYHPSTRYTVNRQTSNSSEHRDVIFPITVHWHALDCRDMHGFTLHDGGCVGNLRGVLHVCRGLCDRPNCLKFFSVVKRARLTIKVGPLCSSLDGEDDAVRGRVVRDVDRRPRLGREVESPCPEGQ
jgi:hypothetical protein